MKNYIHRNLLEDRELDSNAGILPSLIYLIPLLEDFYLCDHSRLLPGGPRSSEVPTVATKVLSPH